jgi:uncharacterized cysteine cluster protein YcgN (CxxCxxCC family)
MSDMPFWEKPLHQLSPEEWEALCDGCGKCCLAKLEYEDTGEIEYTNVACRLLDTDSCRCADYANRKAIVPECVQLKPGNVSGLRFLPPSCAYRRRAEGKPLPWWHYLLSGKPELVHKTGFSARGRVVSEAIVEDKDLIHHVVDWPAKLP